MRSILGLPARGGPLARLAFAALSVLAIAGTLAAAGATAPPANATCKDPPCRPIGDDPRPRPKPRPTISSISPNLAQPGAQIVVTGQSLTGATVKVNNVPASVTGNTSTSLTFLAPQINASSGPVRASVVVSSGAGNDSGSYIASDQKWVVHLRTLDCNEEEDGFFDGPEDEPYIKVDGREVWSSDDVEEGDNVALEVYADLVGSATIELWERDDSSDDDKIGEVVASTDQFGVMQAAPLNKSGADYKLYYTVEKVAGAS